MSQRAEKIKVRWPKVSVAVAFVGVVALTGCGLGDRSADGEEGAGAAVVASQAPEEETAPEVAAAGESICGLPGSDQTEIEEALADVQWEFVGTVQAPSVPEAGPGQIADNGFRKCYAHSPIGALVAASNVLAMGTDPNLVQELNEELVAEGPGREAVLEDLEQNGVPRDDSGIRLSIAGYRLLGYGPDHARIDLAVKGSDGMIASVTTDLRWEAGDWKVELRPDGQHVIPAARLADTVGYNPWLAEG